MYADDMILLSPCVACLQNMLDVSTVYGNEFDIVFNAKKCTFMVVVKRLRTHASDITVCISRLAIPYVDKIKYLGVSLISASRTLDVDGSFMQRRFYSSYNSIVRLLFGLQDTTKLPKTLWVYRGYPVVTSENLVTNNRFFCVSNFSLKYRGVFKHPKNPTYGLVQSCFKYVS